jgi:hypothetical protein
MGIFSTTANGLYGFDQGTTLNSKGGVIELRRTRGKLLLRNGDNLLLQVVAENPYPLPSEPPQDRKLDNRK